jgi:hypothetical protein
MLSTLRVTNRLGLLGVIQEPGSCDPRTSVQCELRESWFKKLGHTSCWRRRPITEQERAAFNKAMGYAYSY